MKRILAIILVLCLSLLIAAPAFAVSRSQLAGYWKGSIKMTVQGDDGRIKYNGKVKMSLASDGAGSIRDDDQHGSSNIGWYSISGNRFRLHGINTNSGEPMDLTNMTMKLTNSNNKLVLKGRVTKPGSYATDAVLTLTRIKPTISKVASNKVNRGNASKIDVKVDQHTDFVRMADMNGRELSVTYDEVKSNTFRFYYSFPNKTNKVKLYAGMKTDDGFVFWSKAKTVTIKCK